MVRVSRGLIIGALALCCAAFAAVDARAGGLNYNSGPASSGRTAWEGTHFGGHLGWADVDYGVSPSGVAPALTTSIGGNDGFAGGFLYGASWQFNNWVLGSDSVWTFSDTGAGPATTAGGLTLSTETNYTSETRGRVGYLVQPNLMLFGALGIAFADVDVTGTALAGGGGDKRFVGFTFGGGVEAMFSDRWFGRVEYARTNYGDERYNAVGGGSYDVDLDTDAVRASLGYRFDWSPLDLVR